MLDSVWRAVEATCEGLETHAGLEVKYARSICCCGTEDPTETRKTSGFSVDISLTNGAHTVWAEAQWTEHAYLSRAVGTATGKIGKYRHAVENEEQRQGT